LPLDVVGIFSPVRDGKILAVVTTLVVTILYSFKQFPKANLFA
jgi:hypothetical protein